VIACVEGRLLEGGPEAIVAVGGGGLGLTVHLSARAAAALPAVGEPVRFWTHLVVREDGWLLFGFPSREERAMFRLLISVSGIGPKLALGLLSAATPAEIAGHLQRGDEKALASLPGIGRKSAARLVVELGQRLPADWSPAAGPVVGTAAEAGRGLMGAAAVLVAMGLPPAQAERALLAARTEDASLTEDLERWIRAALRTL
jgi:Holliday junction DNA helicase RuvA